MSKENLEGKINSDETAEILPATLEIERKFLVKVIPENLSQYPSIEILQGYLEINKDGSEVRIRQEGNKYFRVKKTGKGKTRQETPPEELTKEEFDGLWPKTEGKRLRKTRYQVESMEVDIYQKNLSGLIIAEKEFDSEEESCQFIPLSWLGKEVTDDERYKNQSLAQFGLPQ